MTKADLIELKDHLRHAPSKDFILTLWGLQMLWKGNIKAASMAIAIPEAIAQLRQSTRFVVMPWENIGLLSIYLESYDNLTDSPLRIKTLEIGNWTTISGLTNQLREISNSQSMDGVEEDDDSLFEMMNRIMWQQFIWQRGHDSVQSIVRSSYINYGPKAKLVFERRYGLSAEKFFTISLSLAMQFEKSPYFTNLNYFDTIGVTRREISAYFKIVSRTPKVASKDEKSISGQLRDKVEFRQCRVFDYPLFNVGDAVRPVYMCPFPELLIYRATYFLYFDIVGANSNSFTKTIRKDAAAAKHEMDQRFERFCVELTSATASKPWCAEGDFQYGKAASPKHTTDLILSKHGKVCVIGECKAKKMSINVRLSPRPVRDHLSQVHSISEGILQLWSFARDLREGKVEKNGYTYTPDDTLVGALITLEEWADHSRLFIRECFNEATRLNRLNEKNEKYINDLGLIDVCIISVSQYEEMLLKTPSDELGLYLHELSRYHKSEGVAGFKFSGSVNEKMHRTHPLRDRFRDILPIVDKLK